MLAVKALEQMVDAVNVTTAEPFNCVLVLCQSQGDKDSAIRTFKMLQGVGLQPDGTAYAALLGQ